ncbi:ABC transporter substrate-binding protein [Microbacterium invictum]|uniref:Extracellular solute-binding protein n=1 Tax=Microbacterium invictum TaxID=515415 RepID=A0ABZ0VAM1_9MICO|nr:extracellular solute-binding protein [Microbacterium invictum]WQB70675.1 extracellular solute-binding protein [Microbacterium invictum]
MRTRSKSILIVGALSAAGMLAVTGCAPGGQTTGAAAEADSDGKITVWTAIAGAQLEEMESFASEFETEHDVEVEIVSADDAAIKQKVQAATASGDFPDVVQYFGGSFMQPLVDANAFLPLDDYVAEDAEWEEQMVDNWAENYTFDGKVYAVPFESPLVQLFYNTEIFDEVGIDVPETFDDLLADVATLKEAGYVPITVDGQSGWPMQQWFAYLVMRNGGTQAVFDAVAGELPWDDEVFLKSAEQLKQLIDAGAFQEGFLGEDDPAALAQYTSGRAAMRLSGSWMMNQLVSGDDPTLIDRTDYTAFPTVAGGVGAATDVQGGPNGSLAIARLSPDADLSWEFIKGFTSNEVATRVAENSLSLVPNEVEISGDQPAVFSKMVAELPTYTGFNIFWNEILSPELNTEFTNLQNALVAGQITPQEMVTQLQAYAEDQQ